MSPVIQVPVANCTGKMSSRKRLMKDSIGCESVGNCVAQRFGYANHRPVFIDCLRWPLIPDCSGSIDGDMIPDDAASVVLTERMGDQALAVPELDSARVGDSFERRRGRCCPIGEQDRLPDDKSPNRLAGKLLQ
jgi:hypothetical protein